MATPTLHEKIAKVAHEANRAWAALNGDQTHAPWEETPGELRASHVEGVRLVLAGATPEQLHEAWCKVRLRDGWKLGATKDPEAKTHPNLIPYHELPEAERRKDHLFVAIARALGCGVERWDVKTGTDPAAGQVNMTPVETTIAALAALPAPPPDPPVRVPGGAEFGVWSIGVQVTACKQEADSDYHLALSDGQGNTMIAEAPCPGCCSGSIWLPQIQAVRAAVDAAIPGITEQYQDVGRQATITGVGFFDRIHGQRGVAPNGIEIHPILAIQFA